MSNPYDNYKKQSVETMTNGELLITLYDELLKCLYKIRRHLEKKQDDLFILEIDKINRIIRYLVNTLDFNYDLSKDLYKIYDFILYEISRLNASKKDDIIDEIIPILIDLKNSFSNIKTTSK